MWKFIPRCGIISPFLRNIYKKDAFVLNFLSCDKRLGPCLVLNWT